METWSGAASDKRYICGLPALSQYEVIADYLECHASRPSRQRHNHVDQPRAAEHKIKLVPWLLPVIGPAQADNLRARERTPHTAVEGRQPTTTTATKVHGHACVQPGESTLTAASTRNVHVKNKFNASRICTISCDRRAQKGLCPFMSRWSAATPACLVSCIILQMGWLAAPHPYLRLAIEGQRHDDSVTQHACHNDRFEPIVLYHEI